MFYALVELRFVGRKHNSDVFGKYLQPHFSIIVSSWELFSPETQDRSEMNVGKTGRWKVLKNV